MVHLGVLFCFAFVSSPNNFVVPAEDLAAHGFHLSLEAAASQKESSLESQALFLVLPLEHLWVFLSV